VDAGGVALGASTPGLGSAYAVGAAWGSGESGETGIRPMWTSFLEALGVVPRSSDAAAGDRAKAAPSPSVAGLIGQENPEGASSGHKSGLKETVRAGSKIGVEAGTKPMLHPAVGPPAPSRPGRGTSAPLRTADESVRPKKNRAEMVAPAASALSAGAEAAVIAIPAHAERSSQMAAPIHFSVRSFDPAREPGAEPRSSTGATDCLRNPGTQVSGEKLASLDPNGSESASAVDATGENTLPTTTVPMVQKPTTSAHVRDGAEASTNLDSGALRIDAHRGGENFPVTSEPGKSPVRSIEDSSDLNLIQAVANAQTPVIDLDPNPPRRAANMHPSGLGRTASAHAGAIGGAGLSGASIAAGPSLASNAAPGERATQTPAATHSFTSMRSLDSAATPAAKPGHLKSATGSISASQPMRTAALDPMNAGPVRDGGGFTSLANKPEESFIGAHPATAGARDHGVQDTFAALDAERTTPHPAWIHAGAHHAEAGYLDPALGWVGVRADASAGGVHAAVLPGSAEAAQVLGSHLSGLNAYLAEHQGPPATVSLAAPQERSNGLDQGNPSGQDDGARGGQNKEESGSRETSGVSPAQRDERLAASVTNASGGVRATGGRYISVMA